MSPGERQALKMSAALIAFVHMGVETTSLEVQAKPSWQLRFSHFVIDSSVMVRLGRGQIFSIQEYLGQLAARVFLPPRKVLSYTKFSQVVR